MGRFVRWLRRRDVDMTGVTVLYRGENGTTKYLLTDGERRREFIIEHQYAGQKRLVGCSGIGRFVTAFEAMRYRRFLTEGERSWVELCREDGWITTSHRRTLRKVLKAARADIERERAQQEIDAAGMDMRMHARAIDA